MTASSMVFGALAAGLVVTAVAVIVARNPVRAVVAMIAHFVLTAVAYLALDAPFIAMSQVAVYAGAIMVLFLFVVMLLGGERDATSEPMRRLVVLAVASAVALAGLVAGAIRVSSLGVASIVPTAVPTRPPAGPPAGPPAFGSPGAIGDLLFRDYLVAFELVGVLLLAAMIGAVAIAMEPRPGAPGGPSGVDAGSGDG